MDTKQRASTSTTPPTYLVLGATGKTGRRVTQRLLQRGYAVRQGSRRASRPFDWDHPQTWGAALEGITALYVSYAPDLAAPGASEKIHALVEQALQAGVQRLVLLSGRGEEEAQRCEALIQRHDVSWTVVRASWFHQNFSEGEFVHMVNSGVLALPASPQVGEPFVDAEDIAEVAVAALTQEGHHGQIYEVTGPRLLTFPEVAQELSAATGRPIRFVAPPMEDFTRGLAQAQAPQALISMLEYLFSTVLDGRNAYVADGVQRALGRAPRGFSDYARRCAQQGAWTPQP